MQEYHSSDLFIDYTETCKCLVFEYCKYRLKGVYISLVSRIIYQPHIITI